MSKLKLGVIFGGKSTEHSISVISGLSIIKNLNKTKYNIFPIFIDKNGCWYSYTKNINNIDILDIGTEITEISIINNVFSYLKNLDIVFPVLHGLYGEDGSIQGLFELIGIPYVGCRVFSSSLCMDKAYTKLILEKACIPQAKFLYFKKTENEFIFIDKNFETKNLSYNDTLELIEEKIKYPIFVKPSNSGSSIGIRKTHNRNELKDALLYASNFDNKILVEESINAIDMECAILGAYEPIASCVGEVIPDDEFYSFNAKYKSNSKIIIPANITKENIIKELAIKAFKTVDARGLARVDFLIDKDSDNIYLCEINTMPGFTNISMYPKLFEYSGISYEDLLDKLIELSLNKS